MKRGNSESLPILSNIRVPGMLYASTIRSKVARGKNALVLTEPLPAGYSRILPSDLEISKSGLLLSQEIPIFAKENISYRGEPLGLILGPDPGICDELASNAVIECDVEEPELEWESFSSSQIVGKQTITRGNPDRVPGANLTIERCVYRDGAYDHCYGEPMGAIAQWEYDKLAIHCATQWPSHVQHSVAESLGVYPEDISLKPCQLGRALDGRLWFPSLVACQSALAARFTGKPVRILYTRAEDFLYTSKQARSSVTITSATDDSGKIQRIEIRILINVGAYNPLADEILHQALSSITAIYDCPDMKLEAYAIRSNIVPLGAMGGVGATHAAFSIEAHMNHLAKLHRKNPAEIKALNILSKSAAPREGIARQQVIPFARLHDKLEKISDYKRKYASYELVKKRDPGCREGIIRGVALTVGYQTSTSYTAIPGMNTYSVEAVLDRDLGLTIRTHMAIASEHLKKMWRMTAAAALSIPEDSVRIALPEGDSFIPGGPLTLSRGSYTINRLIERSCRSIQKKRFRESLPLTARAQVKSSLHDLGATRTGPKSTLFDTPSWCGAAVEVEIDTLSGEPLPLAVWMVIDAGKIVCRECALSSLRSSILLALKLCTAPSFNPDQPGTQQFLEHSVTQPRGLPSIEIEFLDSERSGSSRGIGELPFITIPAAFYSAVTQAIGIEPRTLPLRGSEILKLLESS